MSHNLKNRNNTGQKLFAAITGVTAMTLFSWCVSVLFHTNYKEPQLLAKIIADMLTLTLHEALPIAWIAHYLVGVIFIFGAAIIYRSFLDSLFRASIFGFLCGIVGIIVWNILYLFFPSDMPRSMVLYSVHLLFAHIIFGFFSSAGILFMQKKSGRSK